MFLSYHIISSHQFPFLLFNLLSRLLGWIRELIREGIEPNPGPAFPAMCKWLRETFAEVWDEATEAKLQELTQAVKSEVGHGFLITDDVKQFFDQFPKETRALDLPFRNAILEYIRTYTPPGIHSILLFPSSPFLSSPLLSSPRYYR